MEVDFVTKCDLDNFRIMLLNDIKGLLQNNPPIPHKEWLKATEVRKLLGISTGTLQSMRIKGILRSSKIGGVHYYRYRDVDNLLEQGYALK